MPTRPPAPYPITGPSHFSTSVEFDRHQNNVVSHILWMTEAITGVPIEAMMGDSRVQETVDARHLAMTSMRDVLGLSYPRIKRVFNRPDHTTVMKACDKVRQIILTEDRYREQYAELVAYGQSTDASLPCKLIPPRHTFVAGWTDPDGPSVFVGLLVGVKHQRSGLFYEVLLEAPRCVLVRHIETIEQKHEEFFRANASVIHPKSIKVVIRDLNKLDK